MNPRLAALLAIAISVPAAAEEFLPHNGQPWVTTARVIADASEVTIPFPTPFLLAPHCLPAIPAKPTAPLEVAAVSRRFVTVRGDFRAGDNLAVSCDMNVTRRLPDPDAVYPR